MLLKTRPKTKKPSMYRVLILNDDYTPMEFVVLILEKFFNKNRQEATDIMLHVHAPRRRGVRRVHLRSRGDEGGAGHGFRAVERAAAAMHYGEGVMSEMSSAIDFNIRALETRDQPDVQAIADIALGAGYFTPHPSEIILVAERGNNVVGFVCGSIGETAAELRTICVDIGQRGQGLGHKLGVAFCAQAQGSLISSPAWVQADGEVPAGPLLNHLGFEAGETKGDYWREDSLERGYACPDCGPPPCHCSAVIYRRPAEKLAR